MLETHFVQYILLESAVYCMCVLKPQLQLISDLADVTLVSSQLLVRSLYNSPHLTVVVTSISGL